MRPTSSVRCLSRLHLATLSAQRRFTERTRKTQAAGIRRGTAQPERAARHRWCGPGRLYWQYSVQARNPQRAVVVRPSEAEVRAKTEPPFFALGARRLN
jgi:hypothetical protein